MLSDNRNFNFLGILHIKRSKTLQYIARPKDDIVNWLFLAIGNMQYSFVYKIVNPDKAQYDIPFEVLLSFTMIEEVNRVIQFNETYKVFRGQEDIGSIILTQIL